MFDASEWTQWCEIKRPKIIDLWFSPQGSYLATWERPSKSITSNRCPVNRESDSSNTHTVAKLEDGSGSLNLIVWDAKTGEQIAAFSQKSLNSSSFQWTSDEKYCARLVTNEIQFWESKSVGKAVWAKLRLEGVAQFSLSPGKAPAVAVFIPERKVTHPPPFLHQG